MDFIAVVVRWSLAIKTEWAGKDDHGRVFTEVFFYCKKGCFGDVFGTMPPKDIIELFGWKSGFENAHDVKAEDVFEHGVFTMVSGIRRECLDQGDLVAGGKELGDALGAGAAGADVKESSRASEKLRNVGFQLINSTIFLHGFLLFLLHDPLW